MINGRRRVVTSKPTRNGCLTCRVRRVKCDEVRPVCDKCSSTGRKCDGYSAGQSPSDRAISSRALRPSSGPDKPSLARALAPQTSIIAALDDSERFAYDYFLQKTASQIQQLSPENGWVQLALQLSREAGPITYAIAALGSVHQAQLAVTHVTLTQPLAPLHHHNSMRHYDKAIMSLQSYIDNAVHRDAPIEPVLLASLLLACLGVMHGSGETAFAHLRSGCQIVRERTALISGMSNYGDQMLSLYSRNITAQLLRLFERLEGMFVQPDEIAKPGIHCQVASDRHLSVPKELLEQFSSVNDAKTRLDALIQTTEQARAQLLTIAEAHVSASHSSSLDFSMRYCLTNCLTRVVSLNKTPELELRMEALLKSHQAWQNAFTELESVCAQPQSRLAILMMRLRHFTSYFTLSTCRETEEALSDRFNEEFNRVLLTAEEYLQGVAGFSLLDTGKMTPVGLERQRTFSLQMGLLPALNLICFKCREPKIRRRAITLLHRADRREGLFWSGLLAAQAEAVQDLEEQRWQELHPSDSGAMMAQESGVVLPEDSRFSEVILAPDVSKGYGSLQIICGRFALERGQEIELLKYRGSGYPIRTEKVCRISVPYG